MGFFSPSPPKPKPIVVAKKPENIGAEKTRRRRRSRAAIVTRRGEFGTGDIATPGLKTTLG